MRYTWAHDKNHINRVRHGIGFETAVRIFDGPTVEKVDDRFEYGEIRIYAIGLANGVETSVIYTEPEEHHRRIISAWKSERYERESYWRNRGQRGN